MIHGNDDEQVRPFMEYVHVCGSTPSFSSLFLLQCSVQILKLFFQPLTEKLLYMTRIYTSVIQLTSTHKALTQGFKPLHAGREGRTILHQEWSLEEVSDRPCDIHCHTCHKEGSGTKIHKKENRWNDVLSFYIYSK